MTNAPRPYSYVNKLRFLNVCYEHNRTADASDGIGTLKEKRIHKVLKDYFDPDKSHQEIPHLGYIADIKNDDGIIEIQTGGLSPLYPKLAAFLPESKVTLVHPMIAEKTLSWIDPKTAEITPKRKSPLHEKPIDGIIDLYNIRSHLGHENLNIRLVFIEVDEYRYRDGYARGGRKGSHRYDRIPIQLFDIVCLDSPVDYLQFLPEEHRSGEFTTTEYAKSMKISRNTAYYALTVLTSCGLLRKEGKRGNSYLYTMNSVL